MDPISSAYQKFCVRRNPSATEDQVSSLENRIGVRFPPDYRQFLFSYNGGEFNEPVIRSPSDEFPEAALWFMYGLNAVEPTTELARPFDLALFDDNSPPQVLPIGSTPMGHLILLITHPDPADYGTVGFKMAFGASYFLANGINDFFALLREP